MSFEPISARNEEIATAIVNASFLVHKALGPGLPESVYEICLDLELRGWGLEVRRRDTSAIVLDNVGFFLAAGLSCSVFSQTVDSTAWGGDHVGKAAPEFMSGDECLFCHRDVGPGWPRNRHGQTIRAIEAGSPAVVALAQLPMAKSL